MPQTQLIRKHLEWGRSISPLEALNLYSCMRLASRINDLKNEGMIIQCVMITQGKKKFAKYFVEKV